MDSLNSADLLFRHIILLCQSVRHSKSVPECRELLKKLNSASQELKSSYSSLQQYDIFLSNIHDHLIFQDPNVRVILFRVLRHSTNSRAHFESLITHVIITLKLLSII